ncbi:MAG: MerR family transcriptional regulator, partial [Clostridia bacterium]|nr:MerR family transcriptional regulator [Clostridia bacterium]
MLTIGAFAKLCDTTTKTLRYYHNIGILIAAHVDESSNYRYYLPEQKAVFDEIRSLEKLGYTLREIQNLLPLTEEQKQQALQGKKQELSGSILNIEKELVKFGELINKPLTPSDLLIDLPFENCDQMLGKWELIGETSASYDLVNITPIKEPLYSVLYFLPGGAFYRHISWSKGVVYVLSSKRRAVVANGCRMVERNKERFLVVEWDRDVVAADDDNGRCYVYRQVDNKSYALEETYVAQDKVDLPYVMDEAVIGRWLTCDLVSSVEAFSPKTPRTSQKDWWITKMQITQQGLCIWTFRGQSGEYERLDSYTKGVILDKENQFANRYWVKEIDGKQYLLVEHKSGDYLYNGRVSCY